MVAVGVFTKTINTSVVLKTLLTPQPKILENVERIIDIGLIMTGDGIISRHDREFWSEKHAVVATIANHIEGQYVRVAYNKGMPGWGYMHNEPCRRLKNWLYYRDIETSELTKRKIHIWYLGDSDTYGHTMDRLIIEQLRFFGLLRSIEFKRIAVIPSQVREYGLIESFDKDKGYEIDALNAFNPTGFKQLLLDHIEPYFDERIHKLVLKKFNEQDINKRVRSSLDENYPPKELSAQYLHILYE